MSTIATNGQLTLTIGNSNPQTIAGSGSATMAGTDGIITWQTVTTTPTLLNLGAAASIGKLLLKVLAGTGTQKVKVTLDNGALQLVSEVPEGEFIILVNPPANLYVSVNAGTIQIHYGLGEQ